MLCIEERKTNNFSFCSPKIQKLTKYIFMIIYIVNKSYPHFVVAVTIILSFTDSLFWLYTTVSGINEQCRKTNQMANFNFYRHALK